MHPNLLTGLLCASVLSASASASAQDNTGTWCSGAGFGHAVAFHGKVDGAGARRVFVGQPALLGAWTEPSRVTLWGNFTVQAEHDGDQLGRAVEAGLDLDGDGWPELLAGAPGDDDQGPECGSVVALDSDGSVLYRIFGSNPGDELGGSLQRLGDFDGDGRDEYLAGATQPGNGGTGYAVLVSGANGSFLRTHWGSESGEALWSCAGAPRRSQRRRCGRVRHRVHCVPRRGSSDDLLRRGWFRSSAAQRLHSW